MLEIVAVLCALNSPPNTCLKEREFHMPLAKEQWITYQETQPPALVIMTVARCQMQAQVILSEGLGALSQVYRVARYKCVEINPDEEAA